MGPAVGAAILKAAPYLMKVLSVAGTVAMFLVGGGILTHGVPAVQGWIDHLAEGLRERVGSQACSARCCPRCMDALVGVLAGTVVLLGVSLIKRIVRRAPALP